MKPWGRVRIYGKKLERRGDTFEIEYSEHKSNGVVIHGTEEFSGKRFCTSTVVCNIWVWDGATYRKDGARVFQRVKACRIRKSDRAGFIALAKKEYGSKYALVQCRFS